ncbi:hypothetical protein BIV57_13110 [Mangrovactinospora gilvigrisea]|uniref:Recombinase RecQ n=1 Tax=Mangrovactinospora gilvigrisea TaxID=1428644 RepID=A0A1J7BEE0_9ACTN|nr:hypothetical protein BIV57_13110 [Mangrovactinospora gilvigrisea]
MSTDVSAEGLAAARAALGRPGVEVEPRRMWPTGMPALGVEVKGRIPAGEQAGVGRALGRLSDIGWGSRLRPLFAPGAQDGPVSQEVAAALVEVLADWSRGEGAWSGAGRPVGVVTIASTTRPLLVRSLGERLAAVGRLPLLGELLPVGPGAPGGAGGNSAQRLGRLWDAFVPGPGLVEAIGASPGPLLLVDDLVDSGWTMAVAARLLRRAGAAAVLPVALAQQG